MQFRLQLKLGLLPNSAHEVHGSEGNANQSEDIRLTPAGSGLN